ncbi:ATP-binding cassette domain-containing protein [Gordonia amarae]|mgnify:FL=1|uniref:ATP-binding cassette domain-containing protein n=2 Tax=Gordonia amarae TaxID=36821 RepID=A0A857KPR8_9ACTN|nr:ABC transporter ATP-binding protein [Gordonia amarae]MCS3876470.1 ABC-2 type transport system ATP-binding protein [Gordonia amarae]QHN19381.1 ATP-binding cassette domain-containing protein [Gordonia amarae]QHN23857.1 ATP-binding cassette domain-containing protein [Gordonia amarae]QHN32767.1 ATP-binding cassette domain-containing protein [Gordonia amarae]QHN41486.1 ATP-binding cassette domain-containing protein [Gordonia amarae]
MKSTAVPAISVSGLTKRYGRNVVLDGVDFTLDEGVICGLFGRNGSGKTTIMSILTAQNFPSGGQIRIFGEDPYENPRVLPRMCFVRENQKYPDDARPHHAFEMARLFYPNWNDELANELVDAFNLPRCTRIKKFSRGQLSAVGVIIGLASRADITFFDEPYLGLDAIARQTFYDRLLADYAEHPRTILLSSHLIDEIADLIERVLVVDGKRIVVDTEADELRAQAFSIVGKESAVDEFAAGREELHRERLGPVASATIRGHITDDDQARIAALGLTSGPVSMQELIVRMTQHYSEGALR